MDLEKLPSGKFATNALILTLAGLAYNIFRGIRQLGLAGERTPVKHPAKRHRINVIQEMLYLAARLVTYGRSLKPFSSSTARRYVSSRLFVRDRPVADGVSAT